MKQLMEYWTFFWDVLFSNVREGFDEFDNSDWRLIASCLALILAVLLFGGFLVAVIESW